MIIDALLNKVNNFFLTLKEEGLNQLWWGFLQRAMNFQGQDNLFIESKGLKQ